MKPSVALQSWTGLFKNVINEEHVVKINDHLSVFFFFKVQPVYQEN